MNSTDTRFGDNWRELALRRAGLCPKEYSQPSKAGVPAAPADRCPPATESEGAAGEESDVGWRCGRGEGRSRRPSTPGTRVRIVEGVGIEGVEGRRKEIPPLGRTEPPMRASLDTGVR